MTDLNDLLVTSPDQNKERLEILKVLFPDLFTDEGRLNTLELKKLFEDGVATDREQYAFTWKGKGKAKRHAFTPSRAALTYDPNRSVNPDKASGNMIIEGENLEVLKLLTSAYREQVKCIYIDPPYNTGGDFIYPDNYTKNRKEYWEENGSYKDGVKLDTNTETSGRYHSDWLSMMYSRILVARQLLREDGVIFASIDDNEVHNLKRLMEEVFGEENFIGQIAVQLNPRGRHLDKFLAQTHEHILVFAKDVATEPMNQLEKDERMVSEYNKEDKDGNKYRELGLRNRNPNFNKTTRPNLYYPIFVNPKTGEVSLEEGEDYTTTVYPLNSVGEDSCWTWGKKKFVANRHLLLARQTKNGEWRIFRRDYHLKNGRTATTLPKALWLDKEINNDYGKKAIQEMFEGNNIFDFPKAPYLIKKISRIGSGSNDIVMDFFAGSGVTAQAILELNEEENTIRNFVLVQLPEQILDKTESGRRALKLGYKTISDITIERSKRVIQGYGNNPQPLDTGFKVYRLTKSHFPRAEFQPDPDKSNEENVELLKQYIAEKEASFQMAFEQDDVFDEVLLKHGLKLDYKLTKQDGFSKNAVYLAEEGDRKTYICFDTNVAEETIDYFKTHTDTMFICLERALDTTKKWNLNHTLGERLKAI